MAIGRKFKVLKNGAVLAGARAKTMTLAGEPIDLSNDASDGFRVLDSNVSSKSVDISVEGILVDEILRAAAFADDPILTDISLEFEILNSSNSTPATLTGDFAISGYSESGNYDGEVTFSCTLLSSGPYVRTAEAA